jgi:serine/threonine-protein kinase RsbW
MKRSFPRDIKSLEKIHKTIVRFVQQARLEESVAYSIDLVVEELFVNMVKYNSGTNQAIDIELMNQEKMIKIVLTDHDVEPFDIRVKGELDPKTRIEERRVGGLGLPLVKRMVDHIEYDYQDRTSTITLTKYLEEADVRDQDG